MAVLPVLILWYAQARSNDDKLAVVRRARSLDQDSQFDSEWRQLESYLQTGTAFANLAAAEFARRNLAEFVRHQPHG